MELQSFCFDHAGMFVIPAECIGPAGLDPAFVDAMLRAGRASPEWASRLGEVVREHDDALRSLHRRARTWWFPPRRQNLCVVEAPTTTRPFYQPIDGASWLLVASDYEPSTSSLGFGVFMLLQAERLALKRSPGIALVHNLSWLLTLDDAAREDFCAGALRCTRPDAEAWRAVAEAMPWIGQLHHVQLRPAPEAEGLVTIEGAGLQASPEDIARLEALADRIDQVSTRWIEAYAKPPRSGRPPSRAAEVVVDDLRDRRPPIVVVTGVDPGDEPLWHPEHPDRTDRLREALAATPEPVAISLRDDLRRIETRTAEFLDWIVERHALPRASDDLDRSGGVYVDPERQLVVVGLVQPGLDARTEAGPPFHRWLVAARTVHEWAHLAVDAGAIPPANAIEHDRAVEDLVQTVERIVDRSPGALRTPLDVHSVAQHYVERQLRRMPDYLANVLASRILPVHEMEAYVRVNVRSLAQVRLGLLERLIRYAYEVQYLGLSRMPDPLRYFLGTTWFAEQYLESAVVRAEAVEELFAAMRRVCGSFVIDPARFRSPGRASQPGSQALAGSNSLGS